MCTVAIVQARMGSTRLPGKVLKLLCNRTVLSHVINRLKAVESIDKIVIATTVNPEDDVIVQEAKENGVFWYRGEQDNVLSRYYFAAKEQHAKTIVRVTSDCPLLDPTITNNIIQRFYETGLDYVSNKRVESFPRGLDTEVFTMQALEKSFESAYNDIHREHVTPYIYLHENQFTIGDYVWEKDYSDYRWTLDTIEDYTLISKIYNHLHSENMVFSWLEGIKLMEANPDLQKINNHVHQKKLGE